MGREGEEQGILGEELRLGENEGGYGGSQVCRIWSTLSKTSPCFFSSWVYSAKISRVCLRRPIGGLRVYMEANKNII